jgi:hypothetical protein
MPVRKLKIEMKRKQNPSNAVSLSFIFQWKEKSNRIFKKE